MDKIQIRRLKPEDSVDISRIYAEIVQTAAESDFIKFINEHIREDEGCFAAEIAGQTVGFMISHVLRGSFGIDKSAWIPIIGVDPKYMGQGIGKALAEAVFQFYKEKGIQHIYTSVRWYDSDVLSFFKTLGFDRSEFINLRKAIMDEV